jgi:hypothetical protein
MAVPKRIIDLSRDLMIETKDGNHPGLVEMLEQAVEPEDLPGKTAALCGETELPMKRVKKTECRPFKQKVLKGFFYPP